MSRLKRIHVNQHAIKRNAKALEPEPPLTVKVYNANIKAFEVEIDGPSKMERNLTSESTEWRVLN